MLTTSLELSGNGSHNPVRAVEQNRAADSSDYPGSDVVSRVCKNIAETGNDKRTFHSIILQQSTAFGDVALQWKRERKI